MYRITALLVMILVSYIYAQTSMQIETAVQQLKNDKSLQEQAKQKLAEDPNLINKIPLDKQSEVQEILKKQGLAKDTLSDDVSGMVKTAAEEDEIVSVVKKSVEKEVAVDTTKENDKSPYKKVYGKEHFLPKSVNWEIGEVPESYVIAPGDEIFLRFWGRYNQEKKYRIDKRGSVYIDPLKRTTYLVGMKYGQLKDMIGRISKDVPGVEGDVRIVSTRPITIHFAGQCKNPGSEKVPAHATFWQAAMQSGGPSEFGSVRDVRLIRNGKVISTIDMYEFMENGQAPADILYDNDILFFGKIQKVVELKGFVLRDGWYELKSGETLGNAVTFAGGIKKDDYAIDITLERFKSLAARKNGQAIKTIDEISLANRRWRSYSLYNLDRFSARPRLDRVVSTIVQNQVEISGNGITTPGTYSIPRNKGLFALIEKAGGLVDGYDHNIELLRLSDKGIYTSHLVDLSKEFEVNNILLESHDKIIVRHQNDMIDSTVVSSGGYVRVPVDIATTDSLSLYTVLQRSKGIKSGALSYVYVVRTDPYGKVTYEVVNMDNENHVKNTILYDKDEVLAFDSKSFNQTLPITILAYKKEPLILPYSDDIDLEVIIHRLDGLDPFTDSSQVEVAEPIFTEVNQYSQSSFYQIADILNNKEMIKPGNVIVFRKSPLKEDVKYVTLIGEVVSPGQYVLEHTKENLLSILKKAGGLTSRANPYSIKLMRGIDSTQIPVEISNVSPLELQNEWILNSGDVLTIDKNNYSVKISGAVYDPRIVPYNSELSWKEYIDEYAGGVLDTADYKKTYIIYPNGMTRKARLSWLRQSKVVPEAEIIVPLKPLREPEKGKKKEFDAAKFVSVVTGALTSIFTIYIMAEQLKKD